MRVAAVLFACGIIVGCTDEVPEDEVFGRYLGAETRLMDSDLVNFKVHMEGRLNSVALSNYAECVAAQYTRIRGYNYLRLVRTNVYKNAGNWSADAVYTISENRPQGFRPINAQEKVNACALRGIPTL